MRICSSIKSATKGKTENRSVKLLARQTHGYLCETNPLNSIIASKFGQGREKPTACPVRLNEKTPPSHSVSLSVATVMTSRYRSLTNCFTVPPLMPC